MLGAGEIGEIRRARYRDVRSMKGISRELFVSRATVQKILRSEVRSFSYEHRTPQRPLMGRWFFLLEGTGAQGYSWSVAPPPDVAKPADRRRIRKGFKPSPRPVALRVSALREGWRMPQTPGSTDNRRQQSIKCFVSTGARGQSNTMPIVQFPDSGGIRMWV